MTVLVTGGAGFIGSHVTERLLEEGKRVVVVDNFNNFYAPVRKHKNVAGFASNPRVEIIKADFRNAPKLNRVFSSHRFSTVVHLGAIPGVRYSVEHPRLYFDINVSGTANVLEASRLNKVSRVVFASTSSIYGNPVSFPTKEIDSTETQLSPYAASKKMGETLARSYFLSFGLPTTCLRFFTVYGPRNRPDLAVYKFGDAIFRGKPVTLFGNGDSKRDYTFVKDVADAVVKAIDKDLGFETINIGNSHPTRLNTLVKVLESAFGKEAVIRKKPWPASDIKVTYADISKARRLLHWKPKTSLKKGIEQFAEWYLEFVAGK